MKWKALAALALLATLPGTAILAQEDIEFPEPSDTIAVGDEVEGELSEDAPVVTYAIELAEGDVISISVEFDDYDGYLLFADEGGDLIDSNDDDADINNSALSDLEAAEDGTYLIGISSYAFVRGDDPSEEGSFTLSVEGSTSGSASSQNPTSEPSTGQTGVEFPEASDSIAVGDEVDGDLSQDQPIVAYELEAAEGDILDINVDFDGFDGFLLIGDENGNEITYNDDNEGVENSALTGFEVPEDGTYLIAVSSFSYVILDDDSTEGDFTLSVSGSEGSEAVEEEPTEEGTTEEGTTEEVEIPENAIDLALGDAVEGELTGDLQTQPYLLEFDDFVVATVSVESNDFDTTLELIGVNDPIVDSFTSDDYGGSTNSLIGPFVFFEGGQYIVNVSSYEASGEGEYTVFVTEFTPETLGLGDSVDASFDESNIERVYQFEGEAGQLVNIDVTSDSDTLDLGFVIFDPVGEIIAQEDDTNGLLPAVEELELPEDGIYSIYVYLFGAELNEDDFGDATLTLSEAE